MNTAKDNIPLRKNAGKKKHFTKMWDQIKKKRKM